MAEKPSKTQREVLDVLRREGGVIERRSGGFWTYPHASQKPVIGVGYVPEWHVGTNTVQSMLRKGLLIETKRGKYGAVEAEIR